MVFIFHRISNYHFKNEPQKKKKMVFNREFFIEGKNEQLKNSY